MSISSTRKVSNTSAPVSRNYGASGTGKSFVEIIDTNNNIAVRDETQEQRGSNRREYEKPESEDQSTDLSVKSSYIPSAIEALAASGVYNSQENENVPNSTHKVNIYGNNQSIIKDEEAEQKGHSYLKHFYEKNEVIEEVDELI